MRLVSHMEKKAAHIFRGEYLFLILNDFMADDMDDLVNQVQTLGANVNCGVQKIILSVDDTQVLEEFVHDTLGSLIRYDRENGTDYMNLLKRYLDQNGSVQKVAEEI